MEEFVGRSVVAGAGVGRENVDVRLTKLLADLGLEPGASWPSCPRFALHNGRDTGVPADVLATVDRLPRPQTALVRSRTITVAWLVRHLGERGARDFVDAVGYTDFLRTDVADALDRYGWNDVVRDGTRKFAVPWSDLLTALRAFIVEGSGGGVIARECNVTSVKISPRDRWFTVHGRGCGMVDGVCGTTTCRGLRLVLALTSDAATPLVAALTDNPTMAVDMHRDGSPGQSFLRVYAQVDVDQSKRFAEAVTGYTVVDPPLRKIIPIDAATGVYMLAYNDNEHADALREQLAERTPEEGALHLEQLVRDALRVSVHVRAWKMFYWPVGTHYFAPLASKWANNRDLFVHTAQRPSANAWCVGEALSRDNQDWVEGALESVDAVIDEICADERWT